MIDRLHGHILWQAFRDAGEDNCRAHISHQTDLVSLLEHLGLLDEALGPAREHFPLHALLYGLI